MAKIRLAGAFPINQGNTQSGHLGDASCCYIPGSPNFNAAYFGINASIRVAVTDENKVYLALNGGEAAGGSSNLFKANDWYVYFGFSIHAFSVTTYEDLPNRQYVCQIGKGVYRPQSQGVGAYVSTNDGGEYIPSKPAPTVGADASTISDWSYVGRVEDLERDANNAFFLYVAYPVNNSGGDDDTRTIYSYQIRVDDPSIGPEIFEYYPWGRIISGEFWSHNRTGGSLKRYNSDWQDVKNTYNNASNSKGFRYNGSDWAISPVTGREQ